METDAPRLAYFMMGGIGLLVLAALLMPLRRYRPQGADTPRPRAFSLVLLLWLLIVAAAGALYFSLGAHRLTPMNWEAWLELAGREQTAAAALAEHPEKPEHFLNLADIQKRQGKFTEAANTLRQAVLASEGNPLLITMYGEALTLEAGGAVTPPAAEAFAMALKLAPGLPQAEYYMGLHAMQSGKPDEALAVWRHLKETLPPEHPVAVHLGTLESLQ